MNHVSEPLFYVTPLFFVVYKGSIPSLVRFVYRYWGVSVCKKSTITISLCRAMKWLGGRGWKCRGNVAACGSVSFPWELRQSGEPSASVGLPALPGEAFTNIHTHTHTRGTSDGTWLATTHSSADIWMLLFPIG